MARLRRCLDYFEGLVPPFPAEDRGRPPAGFVSFIVFYSRGLGRFFAAIAVLSAILASGEALFFGCMGLLVDWTQATSPAGFMDEHGWKLLVMLLLAGFVLPGASLLHSLLMHQAIASNYPMRIRWQFHRYLLGQSMAFFTEEYAGRVSNKVMQTTNALRTFVLKLIDAMVHMAAYLLVMIYMLVDADLYLAVPLLSWLVLFAVLVYIFVPQIKKLSARVADSRSNMVGRIVDSYANIATVKLFGGKGREERYARASMDEFRQAEYASFRVLTLYNLSMQSLNYLLLIAVTVTALVLWSHAAVSPGSIAVSIAIAIRVVNMSRWMMWEVGLLFENIGMIYDGMHIISRPRLVEDTAQTVALPEVRGGIEFDHVSFGYFPDRPVFTDLCLSIAPQEKVGIVGQTGVGKSTLISLLLRFYDVGAGAVRLDGVDIRSLRQDDLRDCFAMVAQDPALMHRSVGENISYGSDGVSTAELERVAAATDSLDFIRELSDYRGNRGMDTMVGERGAKLSGGQRQKIALARVIMKDAPILILDEATSALDSETESIIQRNLERIMQHRTVIAIAHRLSTLVRMDRIIVLDRHGIAATGTHRELLEQGGLYKMLWDRQSNGFIGG